MCSVLLYILCFYVLYSCVPPFYRPYFLPNLLFFIPSFTLSFSSPFHFTSSFSSYSGDPWSSGYDAQLNRERARVQLRAGTCFSVSPLACVLREFWPVSMGPVLFNFNPFPFYLPLAHDPRCCAGLDWPFKPSLLMLHLILPAPPSFSSDISYFYLLHFLLLIFNYFSPFICLLLLFLIILIFCTKTPFLCISSLLPLHSLLPLTSPVPSPTTLFSPSSLSSPPTQLTSVSLLFLFFLLLLLNHFSLFTSLKTSMNYFRRKQAISTLCLPRRKRARSLPTISRTEMLKSRRTVSGEKEGCGKGG